MDAPPDPAHLLQVIAQLGSDDLLMFSTDYPHWDFDAPDQALPVRLAPEGERKIMSENAQSLYRF